jgi:hypothetical protein
VRQQSDRWCDGIHYVNAASLKNDAVNVAKPPASLEGRLLNFNSAPNRYGLGPFYELHVWSLKNNPNGMFADNNPRVSCDAAKAGSQ